MSEIKVGDTVRVIKLMSFDSETLKIGKTYPVVKLDSDGDVFVKLSENRNEYIIYKQQFEKVEKEMTFPEMAQKLINGEFKVGTELVNSFDEKKYWVDTSSSGWYGVKEAKCSGNINARLGASVINAKWTVKEKPVKDMTIEQIQKELGYKIKIVE